MSHFFDHREFYSKPIFLSPDEIKSPVLVFEDYFSDYNLCEARDFISQVKETCLTADYGPFRDADYRSRLLIDVQRIEKVLEAAYMIGQQKKNKKANQLLIENKK
jgi:hypothetical protein